MAYRLRVYAPTDGVISVTINGGGYYSQTVYPAGSSTPCYDEDELTFSVSVGASLAGGYSISRWVLNVDGSVSYKYGSQCSYTYSGSDSNVYIRLEVEQESQPETYYAYLSFNANGGSGAPSTIYGESDDGTGYVQFDLPYTVPTRDGYQFLGWSTNSSGTGTLRQPGETYTGYGSTTYPGPHHTLYAAWKQITTWYAYVQFNANGGSGAPSAVYGQSTTGEYVQLNIPSTKPTRTNYIFLGWSLTKTATTADYYPNGTITVYGSGSSPGTKYVLYAIWQESSGDSYAWINVGGGIANWHMAIPWINVGGGIANWHKTIPWINNGGGIANWKKGMS